MMATKQGDRLQTLGSWADGWQRFLVCFDDGHSLLTHRYEKSVVLLAILFTTHSILFQDCGHHTPVFGKATMANERLASRGSNMSLQLWALDRHSTDWGSHERNRKSCAPVGLTLDHEEFVLWHSYFFFLNFVLNKEQMTKNFFFYYLALINNLGGLYILKQGNNIIFLQRFTDNIFIKYKGLPPPPQQHHNQGLCIQAGGLSFVLFITHYIFAWSWWWTW